MANGRMLVRPTALDARGRAMEIAAELGPLGPVAVRRLFGGAGLSVDQVTFAMVIKGALYLRVDDATRPLFEAEGASPFTYQTRDREVTVASYYEAPDAVIEETETLRTWAARALAAARAAAKPKRGRKRPAT
ncbi:DNA transformation protein [Humitalea rosea]|uniref:DNA transformation protein n=1 Tax=Humitalea rosea TaxID=990373 RepID=A0A2W7IP47_9PROT|nr:TfoX/Sxy family protein [Humitalea rosea]PZW47148.1 DNA transformation protein [Humitalea rosea]